MTMCTTTSMLLLAVVLCFGPTIASLSNISLVENITTTSNKTITITTVSTSTIIDIEHGNGSAAASSPCDNSDETRCLFSRECIPATWRCDQTVDCEDNSDEWPHYSEDYLDSMQQQHLPLTTLEPNLWCRQCGRSHFRCNRTGECIPRGWLCDGQFDCSELPAGGDAGDADQASSQPANVMMFDKSDEVNDACNNIETLTLVEAGGELNVTEDKVSRLILSATRPHLLLHNRTHLATLSGAFYENVSMGRVMQFQHDGHDDDDVAVWVSKTSDSRLCRLVRSNRTIRCWSMVMLLTNQLGSSGAAPPPTAAAPSEEKIYHLPAFIEADAIDQLGLDWLTLNWYLLSSRSELLYMCNARLETCAVLLDHRFLRNPLAFDLDAGEGMIFFSCRGDGTSIQAGSSTGHSPTILRAQLDGTSGAKILVDTRLVEPAKLTLDLQSRRLYWIDVYLNLLESVDYNGEHRTLLTAQMTSQVLPRWSTTMSMLVHAAQVHLLLQSQPSTFQLVHLNVQRKLVTVQNYTDDDQHYHLPSGVIIFDVAPPSTATKYLQMLCDRCEQQHRLCISRLDHDRQMLADCFGHNETVTNNNKTHQDSTTSLLVYSRGDPGLIEFTSLHRGDNISEHQTTLPPPLFYHRHQPIVFAHSPTSFVIDSTHQWIYYVDDFRAQIISHSLWPENDAYGKDFQIQRFDLKAVGIGRVESIALDTVLHNLYLTKSDPGGGAILVAQLQPQMSPNISTIKTLICDLRHPKAIAIDAQAGLMFYSQYGLPLRKSVDPLLIEPSISRASLDGTGQKVLVAVSNLKWPNGLTIDTEHRRLYWCDYHRLERIDYDGRQREVLLAGPRLGFANSIFFHSGSLYFSELQHGTIQRFVIETGKTSIVLQDNAPLYQIVILDQRSPGLEDGETLNKLTMKTRSLMPECKELIVSNEHGHYRCLSFDHWEGSQKSKKLAEPCDQFYQEKECREAADNVVTGNNSNCEFANNNTLNDSGGCSQPPPAKVAAMIDEEHDHNATNNIGSGKTKLLKNEGSLLCGERKECDPKEFACDKFRCIPFHWRCDGRQHCHDGSDEVRCKNVTCPAGFWLCHLRPLCIDARWRCDGWLDCGPDDNSDELDGCHDGLDVGNAENPVSIDNVTILTY